MSERRNDAVESASDREIVVSRVFEAPRDLVWKAWTDPKHVVNWWGPLGFTTTIEVMDVRPGGIWKHVMHGPDGTRYPNKSVFKEVVEPERIVYSHAGGKENGPGAHFVSTWTFRELGKNRTELTIRMVFETRAARDLVAHEFGAIEGGKQTLGRLGEYLEGAISDGPEFTITRVFDARRELVFDAWTRPEHIQRWLAPKGFTVRYEKADIRPGGLSHYLMSGPNGVEMWGKAVYREIHRPERLAYVQCFSDRAGQATRHPMSPTWPLEMLTTVVFEEEGRKTRITLSWLPVDASAEERATFDQARASMNQGWGGTFEQLDAYLALIA